MSNTEKTIQLEADKKFIKLADKFIDQANANCGDDDHQLVAASLMYASARFSAFISAAMVENKEDFEHGTEDTIAFYMEEFEKMLREHMKQYKSNFDTRVTPPYPH